MARRKTKVSSGTKRAARGTLAQSYISNRATVGVNEDFDRSTTVTARSSGVSVSAQAQIQVIQLGLREPFIPSGEEEALETQDGLDYGVLKQ